MLHNHTMRYDCNARVALAAEAPKNTILATGEASLGTTQPWLEKKGANHVSTESLTKTNTWAFVIGVTRTFKRLPPRP